MSMLNCTAQVMVRPLHICDWGSCRACDTELRTSVQGDADPSNTTIFVGNVTPHVSEDDLSSLFQRCGTLTRIRLLPDRGCAFVQFELRAAAEHALATLQGQHMRGSPMRLSWGRSQSHRHAHARANSDRHLHGHYAGMVDVSPASYAGAHGYQAQQGYPYSGAAAYPQFPHQQQQQQQRQLSGSAGERTSTGGGGTKYQAAGQYAGHVAAPGQPIMSGAMPPPAAISREQLHEHGGYAAAMAAQREHQEGRHVCRLQIGFLQR